MVEVQRLSLKQNKPQGNDARTKAPITEVEGPSSKQNKRINKRSFSIAAQSQVKLSEFAASDQRQISNPKSQGMNISQMKVPKVAAKTQSKGCLQIQDPKRHPMNKALVEANESQSKHQSQRQPMKRAIEHNESSKKQQKSSKEDEKSAIMSINVN